MDIGTAIKNIRKRKGYSQKDLANRCNLSVNALCQIENNSSFPQKTTIKKICDVLEIPTSYLLFFSISEEDIPEENRKTFQTLSSAIKDILIQDMS